MFPSKVKLTGPLIIYYIDLPYANNTTYDLMFKVNCYPNFLVVQAKLGIDSN
jgi:hypothetical protein